MPAFDVDAPRAEFPALAREQTAVPSSSSTVRAAPRSPSV